MLRSSLLNTLGVLVGVLLGMKLGELLGVTLGELLDMKLGELLGKTLTLGELLGELLLFGTTTHFERNVISKKQMQPEMIAKKMDGCHSVMHKEGCQFAGCQFTGHYVATLFGIIIVGKHMITR